MRIGIDFDDTLCDFSGMLRTESLRRWNVDLDDLGLAMPVKAGADEVTRRLAERHDLVILTARHPHETELARQWLRANDLPIDEVRFTSRGPKDGPARELGLRVHLDDSARVFDTFADHPTASALLVGSIFDRGDAPGAHVRSVEHWHAFEDMVRMLED